MKKDKIPHKSKTEINQIEEDIRLFDSYIDHYENRDPFKRDEQLKILLGKILYIHNSIEIILEEMLSFAIEDCVDEKFKVTKSRKLDSILKNIYYKLSFRDKLLIANRSKLISEKTFDDLEKFNTLRDEFTHPDTNELQKYIRNREQYLLVIDKVTQALFSIESEYDFLVTPSEYWDKAAEELERRIKEDQI